jgi:transposase
LEEGNAIQARPMPKRIIITPHVSLNELESHYRRASDPIERTRCQIIWLLAKGRSTQDIAAVTGYCPNSIRRIARRYNQSGLEGLKDRRHDHRGGQPLLSDVQQALLWQALQAPAPDGGLWNSRKVAEWMSDLLDRPISIQRGWEYLRSLEMRLRVPRPHHQEADPLEQEAWKKKLTDTVEQVRCDYPGAVVEVWAMDEHRLGLKPVLRRVWVPRGEQPIAKVHWRYQWLWLYGFVHPETGESYFWILPRVNITLFNQVLADFAKEFGVSKDKHIILVIDQAGWHTTEQVKVPEGLHLEFMPSHSPELQPAERMWPLTNEAIANRCFDTLDELEEALFERCRVLLKQPSFIRAITRFHWWPTTSA